jgi:hypothetical protein
MSIAVVDRDNILTARATFLRQTPLDFNVIIIVAQRKFDNRRKGGLERNNSIIKTTIITNGSLEHAFDANFVPIVLFKFDNISVKVNHSLLPSLSANTHIIPHHKNNTPNTHKKNTRKTTREIDNKKKAGKIEDNKGDKQRQDRSDNEKHRAESKDKIHNRAVVEKG